MLQAISAARQSAAAPVILPGVEKSWISNLADSEKPAKTAGNGADPTEFTPFLSQLLPVLNLVKSS
jgi:hypothetical protein